MNEISAVNDISRILYIRIENRVFYAYSNIMGSINYNEILFGR